MSVSLSSLSNQPFPSKVCFIGCGKMGHAMLKGWKLAGMDLSRVWAVVRSEASVERLSEDLGARVSTDVRILENADWWIWGIKPQQMADVQKQLQGLKPAFAMVSILAGVRLARFQDYYPNSEIYRAMPGLSVATGSGCTALQGEGTQKAAITTALEKLGKVMPTSEEDFPMMTMMNGSIQAFFLQYTQILIDGAVSLGLERKDCESLALLGLQDAVQNLQQGLTPQEVIANISSPGGVTQAYTTAMQQELSAISKQAWKIALDREQALSKPQEN